MVTEDNFSPMGWTKYELGFLINAAYSSSLLLLTLSSVPSSAAEAEAATVVAAGERGDVDVDAAESCGFVVV